MGRKAAPGRERPCVPSKIKWAPHSAGQGESARCTRRAGCGIRDLVTPTGSVVRPQRVTPCGSKPPVRSDAGPGVVLTHEASQQGMPTSPFSRRKSSRYPALTRAVALPSHGGNTASIGC
jgi:hypothetical protein